MRNRRLAPPTRLAAALVLVALIALTLSLATCRQGPRAGVEAITVGLPPLEQNALLYVAQARGFFEQNGLQVTIKDYDTGVATVGALRAGEVEVAGLAEFPLIRPAFEGQQPRIIAVYDRFENDYLLVRKDRGINTPADLRGKRIGAIRGTVLEFYLGRLLALHGIELDEVTLVDTKDTAQTDAALLDGAVDAVVAFQPHVSSLQAELGDAVLTWPAQNEQLVYGILVTRADWLAEREETVERFLRSLAAAEKALVAHPDQAQEIVRSRLDLDSTYLDGTWPLHQFSLSLDLSLIIALNDEARWMIDSGLTDAAVVPDFKEYIYLDGLRAVAPESVTIIR